MRVFVVTLLMAALALADTSWTECQLSQATVAFPSAPIYKLSTEESPVGTLTTHNWEYRAQDVNLTANAVKLPALALMLAGPEAIYEDAARALVQDARAEQLSFQQLQVSSLPGAEVTYRMEDGQTGRARFVLVNGTLLTTVATWPAGSPPQSVDRFFGSLATTR